MLTIWTPVELRIADFGFRIEKALKSELHGLTHIAFRG